MGNCKEIIQAVAGILKNAQGEILISLRPKQALQGGLWEFPGGKLEPNETSFDALCREFFEEVDVRIKSAHFFSAAKQDYVNRMVFLEIWQVSEFAGVPIGKEGQLIEWVSPLELSRRDFLPANRAVIRTLQDTYNEALLDK
jgi:8-oxo-dGTP diphosphatase